MRACYHFTAWCLTALLASCDGGASNHATPSDGGAQDAQRGESSGERHDGGTGDEATATSGSGRGKGDAGHSIGSGSGSAGDAGPGTRDAVGGRDAPEGDESTGHDAGTSPGAMSLRSSGYLTGSTCDYGEYLPPGFVARSNWPFLIFLHGVGQDGGTLQSAVYTGGGPMFELNNGTISMSQIPMVVLQPHTDGICEFSSQTDLPDFINAAISFYGLDTERFYISGLSEGGLGTNYYLDSFYSIAGAPVPAAAVSLAAAGEFKNGMTPATIIADKIPVWNGDSIYDAEFANPAYNNIGSTYTTDVFNLLTLAAGGSGFSLTTYPFPDPAGSTPYTCYYDPNQAKYVWVSGMVTQVGGADIAPPYLMTLWPGSAHSASWTPMYSNAAMYQWLLAHPRSP